MRASPGAMRLVERGCSATMEVCSLLEERAPGCALGCGEVDGAAGETVGGMMVGELGCSGDGRVVGDGCCAGVCGDGCAVG